MALVDFAPMSFLLVLFFTLGLRFRNKPRRYNSKGTSGCICVFWSLGSNREYHKNREGWNSFLILSCLSVFTTRVDAHYDQNLKDLKAVLENMTPLFNISKASLYAPVPNGTECTRKLMHCFLLEVNVVLNEEDSLEETKQNNLVTIFNLQRFYNSSINCTKCPACESYPLVNSTTFFKKIHEFIQRLFSVGSEHSKNKDCD